MGIRFSHLQGSIGNPPHDPTELAAQVAYREILGEIPSTGERTVLQSWVMIYIHDLHAAAQYQLLIDLLGEVGGDGKLLMRFEGILADTAASMSERYDLLGDVATIWVTTVKNTETARGAVLTSLQGQMIQLMAIAPFVAAGQDRATSVLERIAMALATRQRDIPLPPRNDVRSRLPILQDVNGILNNAAVGLNTYDAN